MLNDSENETNIIRMPVIVFSRHDVLTITFFFLHTL